MINEHAHTLVSIRHWTLTVLRRIVTPSISKNIITILRIADTSYVRLHLTGPFAANGLQNVTWPPNDWVPDSSRTHK
jgi:hypothetical protein